LTSIPWFDREHHSFVPTKPRASAARRRAQGCPKGHRAAARSVLEHAEHDATLECDANREIGLASQDGIYSPELNPVENVWQYLRQNFLSNRVFENYDVIVEACCAAWNALMALPERIRSITQREWAKTVPP
jgi:hypothetical protein